MAVRGQEGEWTKDKAVAYINNELQLLQKFCQSNNQTYFQTATAAKPFLRHKCQYTGKWHRVVPAIGLIVLISSMIYFDPAYRFLCSAGRKAAISILPVIRWTALHDVRCLLHNPLNDEDGKFDQDNCKICASLTDVPSLLETSMDEVAERYLNRDIPLVVHFAGPVPELLSMQDIVKLFIEDDLLRMYVSCNFDSNIYQPKGDHRVFLRGVKEGKHKHFYAFWQNCFKDAARMFRRVYQRPEFLPTSVELSPINWVFMSSNYTGNFELPLPLEDSVVVLIQLAGHTDMVLRPVKPCRSICQPLAVTLKPGSTLILGDLLYELDYIPSPGEAAITVGLGGSLDI